MGSDYLVDCPVCGSPIYWGMTSCPGCGREITISYSNVTASCNDGSLACGQKSSVRGGRLGFWITFESMMLLLGAVVALLINQAGVTTLNGCSFSTVSIVIFASYTGYGILGFLGVCFAAGESSGYIEMYPGDYTRDELEDQHAASVAHWSKPMRIAAWWLALSPATLSLMVCSLIIF